LDVKPAEMVGKAQEVALGEAYGPATPV